MGVQLAWGVWRALALRIVVASCVVVASMATIAAPTSAVTCSDVYLIWARGSGQTQPFDAANQPQGDRFRRLLQERVNASGLTFNAHSLDYPAKGGSRDFLEGEGSWSGFVLRGNYSGSVADGVSRLRSDVADFQSTCGDDTNIVLAGYSQGAHVIGDFLSGASDATRSGIAFVGLFGDPKFHAGSVVARGDTTENGILEARIPYVPSSMANRTLSFCEATGGGDAICSNDPAKLVSGRNGVHGDEYQRDRSTAIPEAVNAALIRGLGPRLGIELSIVPIDVTETRPPVDVVFVIDTTGSMGSSIASVRAEVSDVAAALKTRFFDARVALTEFRDRGDNPERRIVLNLTGDLDKLDDALAALSVGGGGDSPEAALAGLQEAFKVSWRNGASKIALLITDNPFKNPDPITGATISTVAREALEIDPVNIYPLVGLGLPESQAQELADATEGLVVRTTDSVGNAVVDALEAASVAPIALIDAPAEAPPGFPVTFSAGRSFDPDSVISSYEWDFDDDGTVDVVTAAPAVQHTFAAPYSGLVTLRVVSDDGGSGNAVANLVVRTGAPSVTPPSKPTLTASADGSTVSLEWGATGSGAPATGWVVYADGVPIAAADAATTSMDIEDVPDGSHSFSVAADSDYGLSQRSDAQTVTVESLRPVPFTVAGAAGMSSIWASGSPNAAGGTTGTVLGVVDGTPIPVAMVQEAGLTTVDGDEVLIVRFVAGGQPWELRHRRTLLGLFGSLEVCGPSGCVTGSGIRFDRPGVPIDGFDLPGIGVPSTTVPPAGGGTTTEPTTTTTTTTTGPSSVIGVCADLQRQLGVVADPVLRDKLATALRRAGCA